MARIYDNVVMKGMSGIIGDMLLFSQRAGKTIAGKIPKRTKALTADQIAVNEKFKAASKYARVALQDPLLKKQYGAKAEADQSAFNVAIADYFIAPTIDQVDVSAYTGAINSLIKVSAFDDFQVAKVEVSVNSSIGSLMEAGQALVDVNGVWVYTAQTANSSLSGTTITVKATDLPGNFVTKEMTIL